MANNKQNTEPTVDDQCLATILVDYHRYRADAPPVLEKISLSLRSREILTVVGPSGCGKSTLLDLLGGFQMPTKGEVRVGGSKVSGPMKNCAMVFQQPALFPWLRVRENVTLGIRARGMTKSEANRRADSLLASVGLEKVGRAYPRELSGGMAQRVGIVRALALEPQILLMDEPFAAVDAQTRRRLQTGLKDLLRAQHCSVVFVTHDVSEAVILGDHLIVMASGPGRILREYQIPEQAADPQSELHHQLCDEVMELLLEKPTQ